MYPMSQRPFLFPSDQTATVTVVLLSMCVGACGGIPCLNATTQQYNSSSVEYTFHAVCVIMFCLTSLLSRPLVLVCLFASLFAFNYAKATKHPKSSPGIPKYVYVLQTVLQHKLCSSHILYVVCQRFLSCQQKHSLS